MHCVLFIVLAASAIVAGRKPEFRHYYENVTRKAGQWEYLVCEAEGDKPIEYKWYNQDEDRITDDARRVVHVSRHDSHSRLNFRRLSPEHEGLYTCTASNVHGLSSKVYLLMVYRDGNDTDIDNGNETTGFRDAKVLEITTRSVTFHIQTSGRVEPIEAQYREGKRSSNATVIRLEPDPGNIYKIENLVPSGLYRFRFRTESGNWSREYNVTLLPDAPEIIWQSIGQGNVRLQWFTRTEDILRGTIDRYQVKYFWVQMERGNSWVSRNCPVTIEVPACSGSSYTIAGIGRSVFYQIEVRAHTDAGYSQPSSQKVYMP